MPKTFTINTILAAAISSMTLYIPIANGMEETEDGSDSAFKNSVIRSVTESHSQLQLDHNDGHKIPDLILQQAGSMGIAPENVFITWDFDDTLCIKKDWKYMAYLITYGRFADQKTYHMFRDFFFSLLAGCGLISNDGQRIPNLKKIEESFLKNNGVIDFFDIRNEESGYYNFLANKKDYKAIDRSEIKRVLSDLIIFAGQKTHNGQGSNCQYKLKNTTLLGIFNKLKNNKMKIIGICSNGLWKPEKQVVIDALAEQTEKPIPWYATPELSGDAKAPTIFHAYDEYQKNNNNFSLWNYIFSKPKHLIVHVDDKDIVFNPRQIPPERNNGVQTLLIHWKRFEQTPSPIIQYDDFEEAVALFNGP